MLLLYVHEILIILLIRIFSFPFIRDHENEDGSESGHGTSVTQSPHSVDGSVGGSVSFLQSEVRHLGTASMSLCGGLADAEPMSLDSFMKKVITYDDLVEQPNLINNPDLVIKVRDGSVAIAIVIFMYTFYLLHSVSIYYYLLASGFLTLCKNLLHFLH